MMESFTKLIKEYERLRQDNAYCYLEIACTRNTDYMAWICDKVGEGREVLAQGQGATIEEACKNALDYMLEKGR